MNESGEQRAGRRGCTYVANAFPVAALRGITVQLHFVALQGVSLLRERQKLLQQSISPHYPYFSCSTPQRARYCDFDGHRSTLTSRRSLRMSSNWFGLMDWLARLRGPRYRSVAVVLLYVCAMKTASSPCAL